MSEVWSKWENQVVNGIFPLRRFLGASDHSTVFLTEYRARGIQDAAIKLVPAHPAHSDAQLLRWKTATALSHRHLIRLLDSGRCQLGGHPFLYLVMEYADENLAQILPRRALTPDEVREMLAPTLEALAFLHGQGLAQCGLKPPNILVVGDQVKLASDTVRPVGQSPVATLKWSSHDPPEVRSGTIGTAGDIWGLGITLVEALTQSQPVWPEGSETVSLPLTLPSKFVDTVRRCLSRTPAGRPTVADLQAQAAARGVESRAAGAVPAPAPVAAVPAAPVPAPTAAVPVASVSAPTAAVPAASVSAPAASVPGAPIPAPAPSVPAAPIPPSAGSVPKSAAPDPTPGPPRHASASAVSPAGAGDSSAPARVSSASTPAPKPSSPTPAVPRAAAATANPAREDAPARGSLVPRIVAILIVFLVVWAALRFFVKPPRSGQQVAVTSPADSQPGAPPTTNPQAAENSQPVLSGAPPSSSLAQSQLAPRATPRTSEQAGQTSTSPAIVHEEIPQIPFSARSTIRGRIKIIVRVTADRSGNVVADTLANPGPSRYFARLVSAAARKWKFAPLQGQNSQEWELTFELTREGATGHAAPRSAP